MRVLILGGSGMLGHKLWQTSAARFDAYVTLRHSTAAYASLGIFDPARTIGHVSAENFESIVHAVATVRPKVVVNCIGVVKQAAAAKEPSPSIEINALLPHRLAQLCGATDTRLIHVSTDCVFSGRKGNYKEDDKADAEDLYGRTKLLGEVTEAGCLTIRTSMVGRELAGTHGLVEWFLSQTHESVRGFKRALFSGFTTAALAQIIADVIIGRRELQGLYHVAAAPINKFDLLSLIREAYELPIQIEPDETFICDRSLDGTRFCQATGFVPPAWPEMILGLQKDPTPYEDLRRLTIQR